MIPSLEDIAAAMQYIDAEYVFEEDNINIDGEMMAEALAFALPYLPNNKPYGLPGRSYMELAEWIYPRFSSEAWAHITARATSLARDQSGYGDPTWRMHKPLYL